MEDPSPIALEVRLLRSPPLPPHWIRGLPPEFLVTNDGLLVTYRATESLAPPVLWPMIAGRLSAADLETLARAIEASGLPDFEEDVFIPAPDGLADAGSLAAIYRDEAGTHRIVVAGFGVEPAADPRAIRLGELLDALEDIARAADREGVLEAFTSDALQIHFFPWTGETSGARPWPLPPEPLPEGGSVCSVYSGETARDAASRLAGEPGSPPWMAIDGRAFRLVARALVPGESACEY